MNLAIGSLVFMGFAFLITGVLSKFMGIFLLAPYITSYTSYLVVANTCLLLALIVHKFEK